MVPSPRLNPTPLPLFPLLNKQIVTHTHTSTHMNKHTCIHTWIMFFFLTNIHKAASLADSSPAAVPLPLRVEPKPKSGIRQQDLLKNIVEIRPKRHRVSSPTDGNQPTSVSSAQVATNQQSESDVKKEHLSSSLVKGEEVVKEENPVRSVLGLAYESSEDEED
ncbi:ankyrin repeat protein [Thalictrum thalictroides]|uniref:Ankyrin repeat protein n=1 Tax=Thalictrum thalictroides TaxID=46969 RepID=A0A7J6VIY8_THATH|nr:ankyrin repeat protein [Thalictrum thalictroides]